MSVVFVDLPSNSLISKRARAFMYNSKMRSSDTSPNVASLMRRITSVVMGVLPLQTRHNVGGDISADSQNAFCVMPRRRIQLVKSCNMGRRLTPHVIFNQALQFTSEPRPVFFAFRYNEHMGKHYIKAWRKHRGLTLNELADRMETEPGVRFISPVSISRIERGLQPYSESVIDAMAAALDVSPGMLLEHDPNARGEVIDLVRRLDKVDPAKKQTIMTMLSAAIG